MKIAVVTGASCGIGLAIARKYLDEGYKVFTVSRRAQSPLNKFHIHMQADLSIWADCEKVSAEISEQVERVDVLVNNVGKSEWRSISKVDEFFFNSMMSLNVASYVAITKGLIDKIKPGASVVNVSSMAAKRGTANNSVYCATKFAVGGLTQSWAKEFGPNGVRVNAICPVLVRSEGLDYAITRPEAPAHEVGIEKFLEGFIASQAALGRLPSAEDVANFCYFLTSDEARSISGQSINLDCGVFPQ